MNRKIYAQSSFIIFFIALASSAFLLFFHLNTVLNEYLLRCVNKDFLTWDPELRYVLTLKMMNHLRNGELHLFLLQFFDSPHWPSLRNVFQSLIFLITSHSPYIDVLLSFIFLPLSYLSLVSLLILYRIPLLASSVYCITYTLLLLQADPILLYSLTGMLEVQGMFVFLWVLYYLAKVYTEKEFIQFSRNGWKLFGISFLLYQTKYPYGYMLILSVILFHGIFFFRETLNFALDYLFIHLRYFFRNRLLILSFLLFISSILLPKTVLAGKTAGYIRYAAVLFFVIDFFMFFKSLSYTEERARIQFLLKWIFFPIVFWMLIQPDRFGSYSGQITHVESQGFNPGEKIIKDWDYYFIFFSEFLINGFRTWKISYMLLVTAVFAFVYGAWNGFSKKKYSSSFLISAITLITLAELSLFTTNRLARHTYHLFGVILLIPAVLHLEISSVRGLRPAAYALTLLFFFAALDSFQFNPAKNLQNTEICYTGGNKADYYTPRHIEAQALLYLNSDAVILNEVNPLHVNKADTEYLLSRIAYDRRITLQFDPKRMKKLPSSVKEFWVVSEKKRESEKKSKMILFLNSLSIELEEPVILEDDWSYIEILRFKQRKN